MRPKWFNDTIPLDPYIAPLVFFLTQNGIRTTNSCQGGSVHLYGNPTIGFVATSTKEIERVYKLLVDNNLDTSVEVGLITGFFGKTIVAKKDWYGQVSWLWRGHFKKHVYTPATKLVPMEEVNAITMELSKWRKAGYPAIGSAAYKEVK